jgi:hypothetical protein
MAINQLTNDQARKTLEQILSTPEFSQNHLLEQFEDFIRGLFARGSFTGVNEGLSNTGIVMMVLVILVGLILVGYLIRTVTPFWKVMVKEARQDKVAELVYIRPTSADLMRKAEQKVLCGEFRLAVRDLYMSILMDMDNRHLIAYEAAKTNSEYLREISQREAGLKEHFQSMVNLFESKWYGLEDCTGEDFQRGRKLYTALLKDGSHG